MSVNRTVALIAGLLVLLTTSQATTFSGFKGRFQASCAASEAVEICHGTGVETTIDLPRMDPGDTQADRAGADRKITFTCKPGWTPDPDDTAATASAATGSCARWRVGRWGNWRGDYCSRQTRDRTVECYQPGVGRVGDSYCAAGHGAKPDGRQTRRRKCEDYEVTCTSLDNRTKTVRGRGTPGLVTARAPSGRSAWMIRRGGPYLNCATRRVWDDVGRLIHGRHRLCAEHARGSYYRKLKRCSWR